MARNVRDAAPWRPANLGVLYDQIARRGRNQAAAFSDADHRAAALDWLARAQDARPDGGIAAAYRLRTGWRSSYPETTGYIVPTLLAAAATTGAAEYRERARRCIEFLLPLQLREGGFPGGEVERNTTEPSMFNTAQIVHGLVGWHAATGERDALDAARRAGDWLLSIQDTDGVFRRYLYFDAPTTYSAHASCWLAELGRHCGAPEYLAGAGRHLDWVLAQQDRETGWFDRCGFYAEDHKARSGVTHTIAYTLWGVLTTSTILGRDEGVVAVRHAATEIMHRLEQSGWLPGVLDHAWRPLSSYACLTGNAQMALVWFRLYELGGDERFVKAGVKALDLVKAAQPMFSANPGVRGGIPGSDPIWGDYMRLALPNWAAKFFIDALNAKEAVLRSAPGPR